MYKHHRIERRHRIAFLVLTLTHIISFQTSLVECLTIGGDYENGKFLNKDFPYFLHPKKQTIITFTLHTYIIGLTHETTHVGFAKKHMELDDFVFFYISFLVFDGF